MSFQNLVNAAQKYFPNLQIKYKDSSLLMKIIGTILFFNKEFKTSFVSTIGSTIYYPSQSFIKLHPVSSIILLLHELVHINDSKKITKPIFNILYLFPQILVLLFFPMLLISWKIALLFLIFALPFPAYFRMQFEKRAYLTSLYAINALGNKMSFDPALDKQKPHFIAYFKTSEYYWMWIFKSIDKDFDDAIIKIKAGQRPFDDEIFNILDELIKSA